MSRHNKPTVAVVTEPTPPQKPETELSTPPVTQPTPPVTGSEITENKPQSAQAPKSKTSTRLALRKERQGQ